MQFIQIRISPWNLAQISEWIHGFQIPIENFFPDLIFYMFEDVTYIL